MPEHGQLAQSVPQINFSRKWLFLGIVLDVRGGWGGGGTEDLEINLSFLWVLMSEWLEVSLSPPHTNVHRMKFVLKPLGYSPPPSFFWSAGTLSLPPLSFLKKTFYGAQLWRWSQVS